MNNKKYNKIMSRISRLVKRKLNEDVFSDGRYDRWRTSTPYDDEVPIEGIIKIDIVDVLRANVIDDDELEKLENICKKSGIYQDNYVQVVTDGNEIIADEQLQAQLDRIQIQKYRDIIEKYVYDEIQIAIDNGDYEDKGQAKWDEIEGQRDAYYDSLRKKSLGEKYKFKR